MARSVLGKKTRKGNERFKATPDRYPDEGPVELSVAFDELPRHAFAVWIRLAIASKEDLHAGRSHLARMCGYSGRRFNDILLTLERRGFIRFIPSGPYRPTTVVIQRRPGLRTPHRFVRFSAALLLRAKEASVVTTWSVSVCQKPLVSKHQSGGYPNRSLTYPDRSFTFLPDFQEAKDSCGTVGGE